MEGSAGPPRPGGARWPGGTADNCGPSTPSCAGSGGTRCVLIWQSCSGGSRLRGSPPSTAETSSGRHPRRCCSRSRTPAKRCSAGASPQPLAPSFFPIRPAPTEHLHPAICTPEVPFLKQENRRLCLVTGSCTPRSLAEPCYLLAGGLQGRVAGWDKGMRGTMHLAVL